MRPPWIDERLRQLPSRPWRKVHLDFNNGSNVEVGADFDADEFAATLERAHVDSVVVFAKCVHGYCYYPSQRGPVHPRLAEPDLLGKQVAACRAVGIKTYAYYTYAWDELLAERHPEWLVVKRDRTTYLPPVGERPYWSALCISHPELMGIALAHTREVLEHCPVDGIWFDMVYPIAGECHCWRCLEQLRAAGADPLDKGDQRRHKQQLYTDLLRRLTEHVRSIRPDAGVEYNTQAVIGLSERVEHLDNIDIEALPTGGWGYAYFPVHARYARTFGVSVYGMTGKFTKSWGDYGGLKHPIQLRTELAQMVAHGIRADIGDEPPPGMRLDAAVYETIADAYGEIAALEPYLEGAVPVTEAAVLVDALPLSHLSPLLELDFGDDPLPADVGVSVAGMAQLLTEQRVQFDVVDVTAELERYRLVVLPDRVAVPPELAERLNGYLDDGGAVLAAGGAVRVAGADELWPRALRGAFEGPSPFAPPYVRVEGELLGQDLRYAGYDFALYDGADRWRVDGDALVHARLTEPAFAQTETAFQHPPSDHVTDYAVAVESGGLGALAFPVGTSYFNHGYWVYRELFARLLERLLPERLVQTGAPKSAELTVTHQAAVAGAPARWIVHVLNYSPLRHRPGLVELLEDPVSLHDVRVELALAADVARVFEARTGAELAFERAGGRWAVTAPPVDVAATLVFEERS